MLPAKLPELAQLDSRIRQFVGSIWQGPCTFLRWLLNLRREVNDA